MILVTGASGLLGSKVVETFVNKGYQVKAQRRSSSDMSLLGTLIDHKNVEWVDCDILDAVGLDSLYEGVTHVVHCAAVVSFHQADKDLMDEVNIEGTINVVAMAQKHNIEKLVYVSSVAAIGRAPGDQVITEETKWEESEYNTNYAKSKYLAELEVWRAQEEGLKTAIINPSVILGPGQWTSSSMQIFKYVNEGGKFYPQGDVNYVDIRDICYAIDQLLYNDIQEERFILNGGKVPYKYLFTLIAEEFKKKPPNIRVTGVLLKFAFISEAIKSFFTGQKSVVTKESLRLSKMDSLFANDKICAALDMEFTPVEESIKWTCQQLGNK
jgi:dihydroflavonol-4-reductase